MLAKQNAIFANAFRAYDLVKSGDKNNKQRHLTKVEATVFSCAVQYRSYVKLYQLSTESDDKLRRICLVGVQSMMVMRIRMLVSCQCLLLNPLMGTKDQAPTLPPPDKTKYIVVSGRHPLSSHQSSRKPPRLCETCGVPQSRGGWRGEQWSCTGRSQYVIKPTTLVY